MTLTYKGKYALIFTLSALFGADALVPIVRRPFHKDKVTSAILKDLARKGYFSFLIINVPEIGNGSMAVSTLLDHLKYFVETLSPEIKIYEIYYEGNPKNGRFLPGHGMIYDILSEFRFKKSDVLLIGGEMKDYTAAAGAGIEFWTANRFFSTIPPTL